MQYEWLGESTEDMMSDCRTRVLYERQSHTIVMEYRGIEIHDHTVRFTLLCRTAAAAAAALQDVTASTGPGSESS